MAKIKFVFVLLLFLLFSSIYLLFGYSKNSVGYEYSCPDCNIILISIDTLRADHLGCYGYNRSTSPFIDSLAKKSLLFKNHISQAPFTSPSHMSIFTSLYPSQHLICQHSTLPKCNDNYGLSDEVITLPMVLKQKGYTTIGYHGGGNVNGELGFAKGFDLYIRNTYNFSKDLERIDNWLKEYEGRRIFLFYHTYQVHDPYFPPEDYNRRFGNYVEWFDNSSKAKWTKAEEKYNDSIDKLFLEFRDFYFKAVEKNKTFLNHAVSQYDADIAYMDDFINGLFSLLEREGILNKTIVVFTSDHGEEFYEHGGFVHSKLYQEILHVPLIIFLPNFQNYEIDYYTTSLDLAPTIFDIVGIQNRRFEKQKEGESLINYILMNKSRETDVFSEYPYEYMSLIHRNWKLYIYPEENFTALFNLNSDPSEKHNLADTESEILKYMQQQINIKYFSILKKQFPTNKTKEMDVNYEMKRRLESLGYVS